MFSEVSVYGHLALSFWVCGEAEHHGSQKTKRESGKGWVPNIPADHLPLMT
jgi:hypothetical protein